MPLPASASPPFKSKLILKTWLKAVKKKPSAQVLCSLCQASVGERVAVRIFFPVLFRFMKEISCCSFLNPIKTNRASFGSGGIKLSWKQVTGLLFNSGYFAILHSVHMGVISANMCVGVFVHMFYAQGAFPACAGSPTEPAKCVSTEPTKQLGSVEFVIPNWP